MTPFRFEHDFRAPSTRILFIAYFDPALEAEQDRIAGIVRREVLEDEDTETQRRRVCRCVPQRQLPAVVRPFVSGDLSYVERVRWLKADDRLEMTIEPAVLGGKVEIRAVYQLTPVRDGVVRRTYSGEVVVQVRLVGGRVERGVIEDLEASLRRSAACTQEWLDRGAPATT